MVGKRVLIPRIIQLGVIRWGLRSVHRCQRSLMTIARRFELLILHSGNLPLNYRRMVRIAHRFLLTVLLVLMIWPSLVAHAQSDEVGYLLTQINSLRQNHGLAPLRVDSHLVASAQAHSNYLASHTYSDPHVEANGSTPQSRIAGAGYAGISGENVVGGETATVQWAFNWWVNSPVHLQNMLNDWTDIGIAVASSTDYGRWYTADFGRNAAAPLPLAPVNTVVNSGNPTNPAVGNAAIEPRPTRRPPTITPTFTPSITYTPSTTFTPRPTLAPSNTFTPRPPTSTAIVLEISPQPIDTDVPPAVAILPTNPPAPSVTPTAQVLPLVGAAVTLPDQAAHSGDTLRALIPWAIAVQFLVVGALVVSAITRRKN